MSHVSPTVVLPLEVMSFEGIVGRMRTNTHSFETADLYWASLLSKEDTIEIFASSLQALNPDGITPNRMNGAWQAVDSSGLVLLEVSGCSGVVRRSAGLLAFMLLGCAFDRFQEVMTIGYQDGVPLNLKGLRIADIQLRYPEADPDLVRTQAMRAGLLNTINFNELFTKAKAPRRHPVLSNVGPYMRPTQLLNVAHRA